MGSTEEAASKRQSDKQKIVGKSKFYL